MFLDTTILFLLKAEMTEIDRWGSHSERRVFCCLFFLFVCLLVCFSFFFFFLFLFFFFYFIFFFFSFEGELGGGGVRGGLISWAKSIFPGRGSVSFLEK